MAFMASAVGTTPPVKRRGSIGAGGGGRDLFKSTVGAGTGFRLICGTLPRELDGEAKLGDGIVVLPGVVIVGEEVLLGKLLSREDRNDLKSMDSTRE